MTVQGSKRSERPEKGENMERFLGNCDRTSQLVNAAAVEGADRTSATVTASPAPAIHVSLCVTRIYNTTNPNEVGFSVIQITNLSKHFN